MAITIAGSGIVSANIADGTIVDADMGGMAASKLTGALPAISGSALTGTVGKLLQTVGLVVTAQGSQTLTTSDALVSAITLDITPLGASSKFLVTTRWVGEVDQSWDTMFNIQQDGTRVNINGQGRGYGLGAAVVSYHGDDDDSTPENCNISTLVSTSSVIGTPITFRLVADSSASLIMWTNRCFGTASTVYERGTSEIIITEIGA
jgi:hypothetical protein